MVRRTTRRGAPRRGLATAFVVALGAVVLLIIGSVGGTAGGLLAAYNYYSSGLPDPRLLDDIQLPASTYVYDRTGKQLLARFECQNREQVTFEQLPADIVNATVSAEDRTFWSNDGVDYYAVGRAALANLEAGEVVQGASTITAQVIKYAGSIKEAQEGAQAPDASAAPSTPLDPEAEPAQSEQDVCQPPDLTFLEGRGFEDKLREFILARQVTDAYPGRAGKEQILETYLNLIFYGNGSYGIKAASANYFSTANLADLTLAQSAFLAGLPQLPSAYDPYYNDQGPTRAMARRDSVLASMLRDGYITQAKYEQAVATTWEEMKPGPITSVLREPHFSFAVRREAERILEAQGVPNPEQAVRTGGFRITTTLDFGLQQEATAQVQNWVKCLTGQFSSLSGRACQNFNVNNGALVSIDSNTGEIVAYVGSVDYYNREDERVKGQFDVAGLGVRQPGSAFKPITYSSAFVSREATPATFFVDNVTQFGSNRATSYLPTNADIKDHGPLLAADALRYSLNVPSVMMQYLVGAQATANFAESMGIASADYIMGEDPGLTLTLGSVPVNLVNFTGAYSVFAQQGLLHPPTTIREMRDRNNRVVYSREENGPQESRPMTQAEAYLTHWILQGNTIPSENAVWGGRAELRDNAGQHREAGFKTGTTNDFKDVSGFGYASGSLVTGVWMGNSNGDPMSNRIVGGLFSADGPLYLWHDFMEIALNQPWDWNGQQPVARTTIARPEGVTMANVCRYSGMAATGACGQVREMPFLDGTVPPPDNVHGEGCFDIVQAVRQDDRRPDEWIQSADDWADRYVNGQLGSVGDPTKLKENPQYRLAIAPLPGSGGFGQPICGEVRATPTPSETPKGSGEPRPSGCRGNPRDCTPAPTIVPDGGGAAAVAGDTSVQPAVISTLGVVGLTWGTPLALVALRRRRRRGPPTSGSARGR